MIEKLLCIKKDNNVLLYKVSYDKTKMQELIKHLQEQYSYEKQDVIETTIYKNVPLCMGIYDTLDFCHVRSNYKILEEKEVSKDEKNSKIQINVDCESVIGKTLTETFIQDEDILLDMTKFYKLVNHILDIRNNFNFSEIIDLRNFKKNWDDRGRLILSELEKTRYLKFKKEDINVDRVVLNKKEDKKKNELYQDIIKKLNSILSFEQVGMFPIHADLDELYEIFSLYGERNKTFEFYFGSLERENVKYNMNGGIFINNISDEVMRTYSKDNSRISGNGRYLEYVKSKYIV